MNTNTVTTLAQVANATMTSTQLADMLGFDSKSSINKAIRKMFDDSKLESFKPSLDARGYVVDYHLPELESKMFVAKHDITYLETITQFWIDRVQATQPQLPMTYVEALKCLVKSEEDKAVLIQKNRETEVQLQASTMLVNRKSIESKSMTKWCNGNQGIARLLNAYLAQEGYIVKYGHGWQLTDKGLETGCGNQTSDYCIQWVSDVKCLFPVGGIEAIKIALGK